MSDPQVPYDQHRVEVLTSEWWISSFKRWLIDHVMSLLITGVVLFGIGGTIVFVLDRFVTHYSEDLEAARAAAEEYRLALVDGDYRKACGLMEDPPFDEYELEDGESCTEHIASLVGRRHGPVYEALECKSALDSKYRPRSKGSAYKSGDDNWAIPIGGCTVEVNTGAPGEGAISLRKVDGEFLVTGFYVSTES